jgi:hypothetical protein
MPAPFKFEGEYTHAALVERAVRNATPQGHGRSPRWVAVREVFGWGSTTSQHLCLEFGLDPNEMLDGCSDCAEREMEFLRAEQKAEDAECRHTD